MEKDNKELKIFATNDKAVQEAIEELRKATKHDEQMKELYQPTVVQPNKGVQR